MVSPPITAVSVRFPTAAFSRPLDRALLIRRPLVWRTRIHRLPWVLLILCGAALAAGWIYPARREAVPTAGDVAVAVWIVRSFAIPFALIWAVGQFRVPFGERSVGQYLQTALFYTVWMSLPFALPAILFLIVLLTRVAAVAPDQEFAKEFALHEEHRFWYGDPGLSIETVDRNRREILDSLARYGFVRAYALRTQAHAVQEPDEVRTYNQSVADTLLPSSVSAKVLEPAAIPCLVFGNGSEKPGTLLFRERLEGVRDAKAFARERGPYLARLINAMALIVALSLVGSGVLIALLVPDHVRNRTLQRSHRLASLVGAEFRAPVLLQKGERWLLKRAPVAWSMRLLPLALQLLILSLATIVTCLLAKLVLARLDPVVVFFVFWPLWWGVLFLWAIDTSKLPVTAGTVGQLQLLTGIHNFIHLAYTATSVVTAIVVAAVGFPGTDLAGKNISNSLILCAVFIVPYIIILTIINMPKFIITRDLILAGTFALLALVPILGQLLWLAMLVSLIAALCTNAVRAGVFGAIYLLASMSIMFYFVMYIYDDYMNAYNHETPKTLAQNVSVLLVSYVFFFHVASVPAFVSLIRTRYSPKPG
jgi:hypothetical protein